MNFQVTLHYVILLLYIETRELRGTGLGYVWLPVRELMKLKFFLGVYTKGVFVIRIVKK